MAREHDVTPTPSDEPGRFTRSPLSAIALGAQRLRQHDSSPAQVSAIAADGEQRRPHGAHGSRSARLHPRALRRHLRPSGAHGSGGSLRRGGNALAYGCADAPVVLSWKIGRDHVALAVTHRGSPIPEQDLPNLFDPLQKLGRSPGDANGTGLGLGSYIVHAIAHAHGGRVAVSSSSASGTTFTLFLPLAS